MPLRPENIFCLALVDAMDDMGISKENLDIIGMDDTSYAELITSGELDPDAEKGKLAMYVIRIHDSLRGKVGNERENIQHWLQCENRYLKGIPIELMKHEEGLLQVLNYLERFGR